MQKVDYVLCLNVSMCGGLDVLLHHLIICHNKSTLNYKKKVIVNVPRLLENSVDLFRVNLSCFTLCVSPNHVN